VTHISNVLKFCMEMCSLSLSELWPRCCFCRPRTLQCYEASILK